MEFAAGLLRRVAQALHIRLGPGSGIANIIRRIRRVICATDEISKLVFGAVYRATQPGLYGLYRVSETVPNTLCTADDIICYALHPRDHIILEIRNLVARVCKRPAHSRPEGRGEGLTAIDTSEERLAEGRADAVCFVPQVADVVCQITDIICRLVCININVDVRIGLILKLTDVLGQLPDIFFSLLGISTRADDERTGDFRSQLTALADKILNILLRLLNIGLDINAVL